MFIEVASREEEIEDIKKKIRQANLLKVARENGIWILITI